jgi:GT2 family glycosyltransferase
MEKVPLVGVVILNWNRLDLTRKCLNGLFQQTYKDSLVIVVDNGSSDGSVNWLIGQPITLIKNKTNLGFAKAINQGIFEALSKKCDYVISLNNDAVPNKNWVETLVSYMEKNQEIGFAQGASMQEEHAEKFDSAGIYLEKGFIPNQRASGQAEPRLDITAIGPNAAGAIYRSSMLKQVQMRRGEYFDKRFFAYVEDVDFDLRSTLRGYKFAYVPAAKMYHIGSATGSKVARKKMFWGARNMVWLVYKNAPWLVFRRSLRLIIKSHLANLQFLWREQRVNFLPYLSGLVVGVLGCPLFIRSRHNNLKRQVLSNEDFIDLLTPSNPPLYNPLRRLANLLK